MKRYLTHILLLILGVSLVSCSQSDLTSNELPSSAGLTEEILIVTDSLSWNGETGESLKKIVHKAHPGVIQPEAFFKTAFLPVEHFGGFFAQHQFIFLPTTLDHIKLHPTLRQIVSKTVIEKVQNGSTPIFYKHKDLFATNQTILFLIAKEDYFLKKHFDENPQIIRQTLEKELLIKYDKANLSFPKNKNLITRLEREKGIHLNIPLNYQVALDENGFIWLRKSTKKADLNLFLSSKPYDGETDFNTDSILQWRNDITSNYIFSDSKDSSFMTTEASIPPLEKIISDSSQYSKFLYGLWKINGAAKGGSYVSRTVKSTKNDQLYYIEGFIYAPGQEKLDYIRSLEAIIRTFEPVD